MALIEGIGWSVLGFTALGVSWGLVRVARGLLAVRRARRRVAREFDWFRRQQ